MGDINQDCDVNGQDLAEVLARWGFQGDSDADVDGDGSIGGTDLAFVLANWGSNCE